MRTAISAGLTLAGALVLSLLILGPFGPRRFGAPDSFRWVWPVWLAAFAWAASLLRGRLRLAAVSAASLAATLLVLEIALSGGLPTSVQGMETSGSVHYGGSLGYGPVKNSRIASKKMAGGKVIYDVVYSIDENGFRGTPPLAAASPAAVFFGGSFTFGEGVSDDETFPAVFQAASGLKAINLAYRGYGPHQMLRLLEIGGEIPATARYRPVLGVYLFIPDHVRRAAGSGFGVLNGPRYELDADGNPRWLGLWRDPFTVGAMRMIFQSAVVRWCWRNWPLRPWREGDVARLEAIVVELQRVFKKRYRGDFQVLLWDDGYHRDETRRLQERLRGRGVDAVLLLEAVPDFGRRELYFPHDGHPVAALHRALGLYLAREAARREGRP